MSNCIGLYLLLALLSCHPSNNLPTDPVYACDKRITRHTQAARAAIFYAKATDSYYIKVVLLNSPQSTIDSSNTEISIFCNLPEEYKVAGKVITFDGGLAPLTDTTGREGLLKKVFPFGSLNYVAISKIY